MRPLYETDADLEREGSVVGALEKLWGCEMVKLPIRYHLDYVAKRGDKAVAFCEIKTRNYTMQPPTIPHRVDGYQVDKNFNKCLDCHARSKTAVSQAVPVSVTHYLDRDGNMLAQISTRRYFCVQCHVAQDAAPLVVANNFQDVDTVIERMLREQSGSKSPKK